MKIETLINEMQGDVICYDKTGCACKLSDGDKKMIAHALGKTICLEPIREYDAAGNPYPLECPSCREEIDGAEYCSHCGQALDWSEVGE